MAKGQYDRAISEFNKIIERDPSDVRTLLRIGDIYARAGRTREAIHAYAKVASQYSQQGFFRKAVAVYKQILKLKPDQPNVHVQLAEVYHQLDLPGDALASFEQAAEHYRRVGQDAAILDLYRQMVELAGDHVPSRVAYAEALSAAGNRSDAATQLQAAADTLKRSGRVEEYLRVAERLFYHRQDALLAKELAKIYLKREEPERALAKLQVCYKNDSKDLETLELLADAFALIGQSAKAVSVYREVARLHGEQNLQDGRQRVLRKVLELDPEDSESKELLQASDAAQLPVPEDAASQAPAEDGPIELNDDDLQELDDEVLFLEESMPPDALTQTPEQDGSAQDASEQEVATFFNEADVLARYGLWSRAVEQLKQVVEKHPNRLEARIRLKDALVQQGARSEAAAQLSTLAQSCQEDEPRRALDFLEEALELNENDEGLRDQRDALLVDLAGTAEEAAIDVEEGRVGSPRRSSNTSMGDIEAALEQADSLVGQQLYQEAIEVLERKLGRYPKHPLLRTRIREIRRSLDRPTRARRRRRITDRQTMNEALAVDLQKSAGQHHTGAAVLDVKQVFADLDQDQLTPHPVQDPDTHFDLGIAYKEMGLLEEAVREFRHAMTSSQRECSACTMVGVCLLEKGSVVEAIKQLEQGLRMKRRTEREELALLYELGLAHEQNGSSKKALMYFAKVSTRDAHYRHVQEKLMALKG